MQENVKINRSKYIGGSDIATIMGISHFKKRFDLLLEKASLQETASVDNEYTVYGNEMEGKIRDFLNKGKKKKFLEDEVITPSDVIDYRYHSDGYDGKTVLEIKTTSQVHEEVNEYKYYLVQLLFGMIIHNSKNGILAVYHRPQDFNLEFNEELLTTYDIKLGDYKELVAEMMEAIAKFKRDLVKVRENPWITEEELQPTDVLNISNQLMQMEADIVKAKKLIEHYDNLKASLFKAMVDNDVKSWTTPGGVKITRVDGTEDSIVLKFNEKKFESENPEMYSKYKEETLKKGRSGYVKITA